MKRLIVWLMIATPLVCDATGTRGEIWPHTLDRVTHDPILRVVKVTPIFDAGSFDVWLSGRSGDRVLILLLHKSIAPRYGVKILPLDVKTTFAADHYGPNEEKVFVAALIAALTDTIENHDIELNDAEEDNTAILLMLLRKYGGLGPSSPGWAEMREGAWTVPPSK